MLILNPNYILIILSYVYHTNRDTLNRIEPGSIQHMGENALATIKELAKSPNLATASSSKARMIYFDFLGNFYYLDRIQYSQESILFTIPCQLEYFFIWDSLLQWSFLPFKTIYSLKWKVFTKWVSLQFRSHFPVCYWGNRPHCVTLISSVLGAILSALFYSLVLTFISPMLWFKRPTFALFMYAPPALTAFFGIQWYFFESQVAL